MNEKKAIFLLYPVQEKDNFYPKRKTSDVNMPPSFNNNRKTSLDRSDQLPVVVKH
jgi:hypothetical protein